VCYILSICQIKGCRAIVKTPGIAVGRLGEVLNGHIQRGASLGPVHIEAGSRTRENCDLTKGRVRAEIFGSHNELHLGYRIGVAFIGIDVFRILQDG